MGNARRVLETTKDPGEEVRVLTEEPVAEPPLRVPFNRPRVLG
jgi:hypothetical protein